MLFKYLVIINYSNYGKKQHSYLFKEKKARNIKQCSYSKEVALLESFLPDTFKNLQRGEDGNQGGPQTYLMVVIIFQKTKSDFSLFRIEASLSISVYVFSTWTLRCRDFKLFLYWSMEVLKGGKFHAPIGALVKSVISKPF